MPQAKYATLVLKFSYCSAQIGSVRTRNLCTTQFSAIQEYQPHGSFKNGFNASCNRPHLILKTTNGLRAVLVCIPKRSSHLIMSRPSVNPPLLCWHVTSQWYA